MSGNVQFARGIGTNSAEVRGENGNDGGIKNSDERINNEKGGKKKNEKTKWEERILSR